MLYLGLDVLDAMDPDRSEAAEDSVERRLVVLDSQTGTRAVHVADTAPSASRVFRWRCFSRSDWSALRAFIDARFGRAIPFWLISWDEDLSLAADPTGTTSLSIIQCSYTAQQFPFQSRRHLAILDRNSGVRYFRKIVNSVDAGATETLTVDSAVPAMTASRALVSFLRLCRLDADSARIEWEGGAYCSSDIPIKEIPFDVSAL